MLRLLVMARRLVHMLCLLSCIGGLDLQARAMSSLLPCCSYNINDEGAPGEGFAIITATPCNMTVRAYTWRVHLLWTCGKASLCTVKYLLPITFCLGASMSSKLTDLTNCGLLDTGAKAWLGATCRWTCTVS